VTDLLQHSTNVTFMTWDQVYKADDLLDGIYILETGALAESTPDVIAAEGFQGLRQLPVDRCDLYVLSGSVFGAQCLQSDDGFRVTSTLAATVETKMIYVPGATVRFHIKMSHLTDSRSGARLRASNSPVS